MIVAAREMAYTYALLGLCFPRFTRRMDLTHLNRQNDVFLREKEMSNIDTCSGDSWSSSPDSTAIRGVNL